LAIKDTRFFKQSFCIENITPYLIVGINHKNRLVESSTPQLKKIQTRIKNLLQDIPVEPYVFSGIKGVSYTDNASYHKESSAYLFKTDITGFFPSITRNSVYHFFRDALKMSPDTANIITNLLTIDLLQVHHVNIEECFEFLDCKGITCTNHLLTGSPASTILSYLVNYQLFETLFENAKKLSINMTVYIDDLSFSSKSKIPHYFRKNTLHLLRKNGFTPSMKKTKYYGETNAKLVTGVVISKNEMKVPNKLRRKILDSYADYSANDIKSAQIAKGVLNSARQIEPNIFPTLVFKQ
jgi:hypothetical protein